MNTTEGRATSRTGPQIVPGRANPLRSPSSGGRDAGSPPSAGSTGRTRSGLRAQVAETPARRRPRDRPGSPDPAFDPRLWRPAICVVPRAARTIAHLTQASPTCCPTSNQTTRYLKLAAPRAGGATHQRGARNRAYGRLGAVPRTDAIRRRATAPWPRRTPSRSAPLWRA
jgi:hypothetical protein